ncbi:hypothetical protein [Streptomyces luteireticuli]|uniref:hypothetical protein n=1 Tax=Streptomyces luteireticuli TaxID=173858 RepID=UPI003558EB12
MTTHLRWRRAAAAAALCLSALLATAAPVSGSAPVSAPVALRDLPEPPETDTGRLDDAPSVR